MYVSLADFLDERQEAAQIGAHVHGRRRRALFEQKVQVAKGRIRLASLDLAHLQRLGGLVLNGLELGVDLVVVAVEVPRVERGDAERVDDDHERGVGIPEAVVFGGIARDGVISLEDPEDIFRSVFVDANLRGDPSRGAKINERRGVPPRPLTAGRDVTGKNVP